MTTMQRLPDGARDGRSRSALFARHRQSLLEIVLLLGLRILAGRWGVQTDTGAAVLAVLFGDIDC